MLLAVSSLFVIPSIKCWVFQREKDRGKNHWFSFFMLIFSVWYGHSEGFSIFHQATILNIFIKQIRRSTHYQRPLDWVLFCLLKSIKIYFRAHFFFLREKQSSPKIPPLSSTANIFNIFISSNITFFKKGQSVNFCPRSEDIRRFSSIFDEHIKKCNDDWQTHHTLSLVPPTNYKTSQLPIPIKRKWLSTLDTFWTLMTWHDQHLRIRWWSFEVK